MDADRGPGGYLHPDGRGRSAAVGDPSTGSLSRSRPARWAVTPGRPYGKLHFRITPRGRRGAGARRAAGGRSRRRAPPGTPRASTRTRRSCSAFGRDHQLSSGLGLTAAGGGEEQVVAARAGGDDVEAGRGVRICRRGSPRSGMSTCRAPRLPRGHVAACPVSTRCDLFSAASNSIGWDTPAQGSRSPSAGRRAAAWKASYRLAAPRAEATATPPAPPRRGRSRTAAVLAGGAPGSC